MTRNETNLTNEINFLRSAIASLKSAKHNEIANETRIVINAINAVKDAQAVVRATSPVVARAVNMIGNAIEIIYARKEE